MATHLAAVTTAKGDFNVIEVPTSRPGPGEILLKNEYGAMIAFDTYVTDLGYMVDSYPLALGFSAAGTVAEVGEGVDDLKVGDRITAFSYHGTKAKALQQYSIQPRNVCAHIPDDLPLEEAATIPDNFVTAFYTIFNQLGFPIPQYFPPQHPPPLAAVPILVYGGGSTAAQYAIQLLNLAGYKNIITTASPHHHDFLRSLGATSTFDYRSTTLAEDIAKVVGGDGKVTIVIDAITAEGTLKRIGEVVSPLGTVAILLPIKEGSSVRGGAGTDMHMALPESWKVLPEGAKVVGVRTFLYEQDSHLKQYLMPLILTQLLEEKHIKPSRVRLLDQGSLKERVETGLDLLRNNKRFVVGSKPEPRLSSPEQASSFEEKAGSTGIATLIFNI
ncbi:hypothetical protein HGRIS_008563 [Hohenbuehelia grisea]|uniref:Enoyl reductase (ER) domain-containing protein n=1 Tax=Hohenbuehelia grisea TaxID=104357 RepID=A0ABR3J8X0_9AGAR